MLLWSRAHGDVAATLPSVHHSWGVLTERMLPLTWPCLHQILCDPLPRGHRADLRASLTMLGGGELRTGKAAMATAVLIHTSGLSETQAVAAYRGESEARSSLPIRLRANAADGIRLLQHKTLLWCCAATQFCTEAVRILFSQELLLAAGLSKALGHFPAQVACSRAAPQLPRSGERWEIGGSCGEASPAPGSPAEGWGAELPRLCRPLQQVKEPIVGCRAGGFRSFSVRPTCRENLYCFGSVYRSASGE